jgi:hypothetical protein
MSPPGEQPVVRPPFLPVARLLAQARLALRFYLGLGTPGVRRTYADCRVRAAAGRAPDLVRRLVALYRGEAGAEAGSVETINFRCAAITLPESGERVFFKEFPPRHRLHDVERLLRCSRVDRAWRAAHLLPRLGILTPRAVGTAFARLGDGRPVEYLATEWLDGALPYHMRLRAVSGDRAARAALLRGFAGHLRCWHDCGVYLRDLVKNVLTLAPDAGVECCLTRASDGGLQYWLTDLDQLHPARRLTTGRLLHQMRQLAYWAGPLAGHEADAITAGYLGDARGRMARIIKEVLLTTAPEAAV